MEHTSIACCCAAAAARRSPGERTLHAATADTFTVFANIFHKLSSSIAAASFKDNSQAAPLPGHPRQLVPAVT
jgi:hypothetical protein